MAALVLVQYSVLMFEDWVMFHIHMSSLMWHINMKHLYIMKNNYYIKVISKISCGFNGHKVNCNFYHLCAQVDNYCTYFRSLCSIPLRVSCTVYCPHLDSQSTYTVLLICVFYCNCTFRAQEKRHLFY